MKPLVVLLAAVALVAAPVAAAAGGLTAQDRREIGVLVDRFVKDAVRRENLPAAWELLGPGLSGGTTHRAWDSGRGVTVGYYPVRGEDFRTAWTAEVVGPGDVVLALMFHPDARHPDVPQTAFKAEVVKRGGRWVVNGFYPAATFAAGGNVQGPADFSAAAHATPAQASRHAVHWLGIGAGLVGALIVGVPLGFWLRARRRDRRALAAYASTLQRVSR